MESEKTVESVERLKKALGNLATKNRKCFICTLCHFSTNDNFFNVLKCCPLEKIFPIKEIYIDRFWWLDTKVTIPLSKILLLLSFSSTAAIVTNYFEENIFRSEVEVCRSCFVFVVSRGRIRTLKGDSKM